MIRPREHVICIHANEWISLHPTPRRCISAHMANCSRAPNCLHSQLIDAAGVSPLLCWKPPRILHYCWDMDISSIICRHHLCHCAGSISKRQFSICTRYGGVWRNTQEPRCKTVRLNRAKPRHPVLLSCLGEPTTFTRVYPSEYLSGRCRRCSLLARLAPGAYITHHQWCFRWSLPAALYELPLLGITSKRPPHWPVDCPRHWLQVFEYLEHRQLLRNTPHP